LFKRIAITDFDNNPLKTAVSFVFSKALKNKIQSRVQLVDCSFADLQLNKIIPSEITKEETPLEINFPEINIEKCNFCGDCVNDCQNEAIAFDPQMNEISIIEDLCTACNDCIPSCKQKVICEGNSKSIGKFNKPCRSFAAN